ncbi:MAG: redoxin domain-containing protein [Syntrophales bacterium]|jgi:peroxiredoxin
MKSRLNVGSKAPDFSFNTPWENNLSFYKETDNKKAVLFFLRYYGCSVCQMEMSSIRREINVLRQGDTKVFVILQSHPSTLTSLLRKKDWPFIIVSDPQGDIFHLYHVEPGGILKYMHPAGLVAAIKAVSQGFRHGKFEGKETQMPAVLTISSDKTITFAYYGSNVGDIPSLTEIAGHIG